MIAGSMLLIIAFSYFLYTAHEMVYLQQQMLDDDFQYMFYEIRYQLLDSCAFIISGSLVYLLFLFSQEKTLYQKNLEELTIAKEKEELKYLKMKINPHFIFNGLNAIYHEIDSDKKHAKQKVVQFSDIVRYHLQYASQEKVSFNTELKYLKSYIDFRYQSTADFLDLEQEFSVKDQDTQIAPLLFIPFIENAFKYCSSSNQKKGKIEVQFNFSRSHLNMKLQNTYDPNHRASKLGHGLGIQNVIKRLDLHYADNYQLHIDDLKNQKLFQCELNIAI